MAFGNLDRVDGTILHISKARRFGTPMSSASAFKQRTQDSRSNTAYGGFRAFDARPNVQIDDRHPGSNLH